MSLSRRSQARNLTCFPANSSAFPAGRPIAKSGAARKKSVFDALIAAAQRLLLGARGQGSGRTAI